MRALVVRRYGPPNVFELQQLPDPQPKAGEVLIRVKTIGVNFADLMQRMGIYPGSPKPPFIPGLELAGVVEKIAPGGKPGGEDETLRVGDAVTAFTDFGAYAEWAAVPISQVHRLPAGMRFEDGAAIPANYLTAYHAMFTMGNLQPGDRILIHGAAGGVGIAAVQLAHTRDLVIFGTAGPAKQEFLRKIGVNHAIDYEKSDFVEVVKKYAPDGVEMVMDPIGGKSFSRSFECLGPVGRLVVYGFSTGASSDGKRSPLRLARAYLETPRFHPLKLIEKNASLIGVNLGRVRSRGNLLRRELEDIFRLYADGKIKPVIAKTFLLERAAEAHQYIQDRKNIGKVILSVR
jgi:NADPH:quinone reductase-like Zn-dependent oxidoreductase